MNEHDDSAGIPARYRQDWVKYSEDGEANVFVLAEGPRYSTPSAVDLSKVGTPETRCIQGLKWQYVMGYQGNNLHLELDKVFKFDSETKVKEGDEIREHDAQFPGPNNTLTEPEYEMPEPVLAQEKQLDPADITPVGSSIKHVRGVISSSPNLEKVDTPSKAGDRSHQMKKVWTGTHEDGDTIRVESINTNIQHGRSISKDTDSSDGLDKGLVTEYGRDLSEFRINLDEDTTGVEPIGGNWIQHDRLASKDMDLPGKTGDSSRPTKKMKTQYHEDGDAVLVEPITSRTQGATTASESRSSGRSVQDIIEGYHARNPGALTDLAAPIYETAERPDVPVESVETCEPLGTSESSQGASPGVEDSSHDDLSQSNTQGGRGSRGSSMSVDGEGSEDEDQGWVVTTRAQYHTLVAPPEPRHQPRASRAPPRPILEPLIAELLPVTEQTPQLPESTPGPGSRALPELNSGSTITTPGSLESTPRSAAGRGRKPVVTNYPALKVQTDEMKVEKVYAETELYAKWNEQQQKLTVIRNKNTAFTLNLGKRGPIKVIHSTALQWFYAELESSGLSDGASQVLFKMRIPKDESETLSNFLNLLTSRVHDDSRVVQLDDNQYYLKQAQLLDNRRARQDDKVNELLSPSIRLQLPGPAHSAAEPVLNTSFPNQQTTTARRHRVTSTKKLVAKPTARGAAHVPFQPNPNMDEDKDKDGGEKEETWAEATGGLIYDPQGNVIGKRGEGRFAVQDPGVKVPLEPEWIKDLKEGQSVQARGGNMVVFNKEGEIIAVHPPSADLILPPGWGKKKEFPQWARKERDGPNYTILCNVRVEVNDLVAWVRDHHARLYGKDLDQRLVDIDGPFKVIAVNPHSRSLRLALPKGSTANEWHCVDYFTPIRMNDETKPIVIAQDTGDKPYPIQGLLKLPIVNHYVDVKYFPADHPRVVEKVPHAVLGRRITPNGYPPYDRNIPHRARYLFKYAWWPAEDQEWAPKSSNSEALVKEYNKQNERRTFYGAVEDDPGFE